MTTVETLHDSTPRSVGPLPHSRTLRTVWVIAFGSMALSMPLYSYLAFNSGLDRHTLSDVMALHVLVSLVGIFAAFLPLPSMRSWTSYQRIQGVVLPFLVFSYVSHLTWELAWVILHKPIAHARDSAWAYSWWIYIDGGDLRYLHASPEMLMSESLSAVNALIGVIGLVLLFRSRFRDYRGTLLVMSTAVVHTVLTYAYYGAEFIAGMPSVNTSRFMDVGVRFILLNLPWIIVPPLVLGWGYVTLKAQFTSAATDDTGGH